MYADVFHFRMQNCYLNAMFCMETDYFYQIIYRNEQPIEEDPYADPFDQLDEDPGVVDYGEERNLESDHIQEDCPVKHIILIADYVNK